MTTPRLLVAFFLAVSLAIPASAAEPDKDGFVPLFNGKDLTGWINVNCNPSTFFVKDNEIITTGKPTGFLRTEKQYENFIIDFEWMHVNKTAVGNSGLFVWGDPIPAVGTGYTRGIEVQVLVNLEFKDKKSGKVTATSHGDLFSIWGATCKPDRPHPLGWARCLPSEYNAKGGGEWNHYRVTAKDGVIKLAVNGKEVSGVSECKPRKGYLALESEGAECHFRNIKIKELPSSNPKPEECADLDRGLRNLYFGDLSGWKADDKVKEHWKPSDWRLAYDGKGDEKSGRLHSEKEYTDFEVIADVRRPDGKGSAGIVLRGDTTVFLGEKAAEGTASTNPTSWTRLQITAKGDQVTVLANGKPLGDPTKVKSKKGFLALVADGRAEFANIFIRELK
jgi:hypothetical protein